MAALVDKFFAFIERLFWIGFGLFLIAIGVVIFFFIYLITRDVYSTAAILREYHDLYKDIAKVVGALGTTIFIQSFMVANGEALNFFKTWGWRLVSYTRGALILGCSTFLYVIGGGDKLALTQMMSIDFVVFFEQMYLMIVNKSKVLFTMYLLVGLGVYLRRVHFEQGETRYDLVTMAWWCFGISYCLMFVLILS